MLYQKMKSENFKYQTNEKEFINVFGSDDATEICTYEMQKCFYDVVYDVFVGFFWRVASR